MNQKQKNNKKLKTKTYIHVAQKKSSVIVCGVSSGGETGKDTWKAGMMYVLSREWKSEGVTDDDTGESAKQATWRANEKDS